MKKIFSRLLSFSLAIALLAPFSAHAQVSTQLWKKEGNALQPSNVLWEVGSSTKRISKGWFTDLDALTATIGAFTSGALTIDADDANALRVRNAAGTDTFFNVDTLTGNVQISNLISDTAANLSLAQIGTGPHFQLSGIGAVPITTSEGSFWYDENFNRLMVNNGSDRIVTMQQTTLSSGRIPFTNASNILVDEAALTWNGTTDTLGINHLPVTGESISVTTASTGYGYHQIQNVDVGAGLIGALFENQNNNATSNMVVAALAGQTGIGISGFAPAAGNRGTISAIDTLNSTYEQMTLEASNYLFGVGTAFGPIPTLMTLDANRLTLNESTGVNPLIASGDNLTSPNALPFKGSIYYDTAGTGNAAIGEVDLGGGNLLGVIATAPTAGQIGYTIGVNTVGFADEVASMSTFDGMGLGDDDVDTSTGKSIFIKAGDGAGGLRFDADGTTGSLTLFDDTSYAYGTHGRIISQVPAGAGPRFGMEFVNQNRIFDTIAPGSPFSPGIAPFLFTNGSDVIGGVFDNDATLPGPFVIKARGFNIPPVSTMTANDAGLAVAELNGTGAGFYAFGEIYTGNGMFVQIDRTAPGSRQITIGTSDPTSTTDATGEIASIDYLLLSAARRIARNMDNINQPGFEVEQYNTTDNPVGVLINNDGTGNDIQGDNWNIAKDGTGTFGDATGVNAPRQWLFRNPNAGASAYASIDLANDTNTARIVKVGTGGVGVGDALFFENPSGNIDINAQTGSTKILGGAGGGIFEIATFDQDGDVSIGGQVPAARLDLLTSSAAPLLQGRQNGAGDLVSLLDSGAFERFEIQADGEILMNTGVANSVALTIDPASTGAHIAFTGVTTNPAAFGEGWLVYNQATDVLHFQTSVLNNIAMATGVFTDGAVIFSNSIGQLDQDSNNLFFDNTNDKLGIGDNTPSDTLTVSNLSNAAGSGRAISSIRTKQGPPGDQAANYFELNDGAASAIDKVAEFYFNQTVAKTAQTSRGAYIRMSGNASDSGGAYNGLEIAGFTGSTASTARRAIYIDASNWINGGLTIDVPTAYTGTGGNSAFSINANNVSQSGTLAYIASAANASAAAPMVHYVASNAAFDQPILRIENPGTGNDITGNNWNISQVGQVRARSGNNNTYGFSFEGDTDTGITNPNADFIRFNTANTAWWEVEDVGRFRAQNAGATIATHPGTAAAPGYAFQNDLDTGLFLDTSDLGFASVGTEVFRIGTTGHLTTTGTAPTPSACGTGPSVSGTDTAGKTTIGTGVTTSCTVTFATAYANAPACTITGDQTATTYAATTSTTALTITSSADMDSDVIMYTCIAL